MTIASQTSRISYVGNGSTTAFAIPFYWQANSDIVVMLQNSAGTQTTQVLGTDYSLTGVGVSSGGTCTFTVAPTAATGAVIMIYRDPPVTQTTSYNNNDPFPAKSHETALDKLTTLAQRTRDLVSRALRLSDSDPTTSLTIPTLPQRRGKLLGFDASTGTAVASTNTMAAMDSVISGALATSGGFNRIVLAATFADLRLVTPFAGAVVYMQGYYADNDGGEGVYCWESASVVAHNGGTVIQPLAGGTGRWIRGINPLATARTFGAKGDGTTDDSAALQAFITWSGANTVVPIPSGSFKIVTGLTVSTNGVHLRGAGKAATKFVYAPTVAGVCLTVSAGATQLGTGSIRGITFYSDDSTFKKTAIKLSDVDNYNIQDFSIYGSVAGSTAGNMWSGASSIGIDIYGADLSDIAQGYIFADSPIKININTNTPHLDLDFVRFSDLTLIPKSSTDDCVTVATGCFLSQIMFTKVAFVGGRDGFKFIDTTSIAASNGLTFDTCRAEQTSAAAGVGAFINISSNTGFQAINVRGGQGGGDGRKGFVFAKCNNIRIDNFYYTSASQAAITVDANCSDIGFDNCFWQAGSTATMTGQTLVWGSPFNPSTAPVPPSARYTTSVSGGDMAINTALAGNSYTVANAGTVGLGAALNGWLLITSSGGTNAIMAAAGSSHVISYLAAMDPSGVYSGTAGTGAKTNVYWSAGNARYELQNNSGGTLHYRVMVIGATGSF